MPAIGITGGIATGKTTFCECLKKICPDAKFFNADAAAKQLVDLNDEVKQELLREFGPETYFPGGALDRERLRAIVFHDAAKRACARKDSASADSPAMERGSGEASQLPRSFLC